MCNNAIKFRKFNSVSIFSNCKCDFLTPYLQHTYVTYVCDNQHINTGTTHRKLYAGEYVIAKDK